MKKILYVRNYPSEVDLNSYNLQEIGLGRELVKKGFNCDILYYSQKKNKEKQCIFKYGNCKLNIIWMKGYKFLDYVYFPKILKKTFLSQYDAIISTEYYQLMSYLLCKFSTKPVLIYNGPYEDIKKLKLFQKLYDILAKNVINNRSKKILVKSDLSKKYLIKKGLSNIETVGVGLNPDNFNNNEKEINEHLKNQLNIYKTNKKVIYVGQLQERRNIKFLLEVFSQLVSKVNDIKLFIVGTGKKEDVQKYKNYAQSLGIINNIVYYTKLKQKDLTLLYKNADLFLFPSKYDIFGMVLLESMYFGVPVLSSMNGGSTTLIENKKNGFIIADFNAKTWANCSIEILENTKMKQTISQNSVHTIKSGFTWEKISERFIEYLKQ